MPIVSILPNGGKAYTPSPTSSTVPVRSETTGWSRAVARRNTDFLLSVRADELTGFGFAVSLTIKDCPPTPKDWKRLLAAFFERLRRMGHIRVHWLTEWQRRGVPHMHAAIWFDTDQDPSRIMQHWIEAAAPYRAGIYAQDVKPIRGAVGWFEYLAKHATRSVTNYQRSSKNVPQLWRGVTGRMWGHLGDWPTDAPQEVDVPPGPWHQYRRLMVRYQIGKARRQRDRSRERYLKAYRSKAPRETSRAQALPRLFIPREQQWELLALAISTHYANPPRFSPTPPENDDV